MFAAKLIGQFVASKLEARMAAARKGKKDEISVVTVVDVLAFPLCATSAADDWHPTGLGSIVLHPTSMIRCAMNQMRTSRAARPQQVTYYI